MNQQYRDTVTELEAANTDPEYLLGWQGGFLQHPMREEQRITEAYQAGYEDGEARTTENSVNWQTK
ncbi:MAG: hypothetical protein AAF353_12040 [Pseudomonadota bacterium]